ncbi:hypothetical protein [Sphingomonas sp. SRS2]|uniref:hypothetical protein n=1 Tax=Sphingomonas sp. SRS2 TaxID=133190 RepID=UPI0006184B61|nr:hypothetical protein [Sphingomonas sp. SRS2]KKC24467.1 hypothetical protein WP12_19135 [Sphingomonas sp. SRS2]
MTPHIRAMVAAAAYAFITGKKVAGLYDHAAGKHLRIAAEARGESLQGFDGDRSAKFGGTLPEIYDAGDKAYVSLVIDGMTASGYDRASSGHHSVKVSDRQVQVHDHGEGVWFAFDVQVA